MASILALKRRIQAAQNVSKTTKAMQMIAASKMKRAQKKTLSTRPYVEKLMNMTSSIAGNNDETAQHPYIRSKSQSNKTLIIILSPDKGLCGGLITNLVREFLKHSLEDKNAVYLTIGKKIEVQVAHRNNEIIASFSFGNTTPILDMVYPITRIINDQYLNGKVSTVKIITAHFVSIFLQTPKITTILPLAMPENNEEKAVLSPTLFEPNLSDILSPLLTHYLEMTVYQHLLESFVSEQASRMLAMQNATDNANDIIEDLKLEYNKTRQARITSEILDISSAGLQIV